MPLDSRYDEQIPAGARWNLSMLKSVESLANLAFIIDLTKTDRYYTIDEADRLGITVQKVECDGYVHHTTMIRRRSGGIFVNACGLS